jgi:hypothetical protein
MKKADVFIKTPLVLVICEVHRHGFNLRIRV